MENKDRALERMQKMTAKINEEDLEKVAGGSGKSISIWDKACSHFECRICMGQGREETVLYEEKMTGKNG